MEDFKFKSTIKNVREKNKMFEVELEDSFFYPDGAGGQLGDRGQINLIPVLKVLQDKEGVKIHYLEESPGNPGTNSDCRILQNRRTDIGIQHTSQHLLSSILFDLYSLNTIGFQMGEEYSTIDVDSADFDWNKAETSEEVCLEKINESLKVEIINVKPQEAAKLPLRKKISEKLQTLETLRLVKIGEIDYSLCGGFHAENTQNLNLIKILKFEKIKSENTRIFFAAGKRALKDYQKRTRIISQTTNFLSTSMDELQMRLQNLISDNKSSGKVKKILSESLASEIYTNIQRRANERNEKRIIKILPSEESAKSLSGKLLQEKDSISILLYEGSKNNGYIISSTNRDINAKQILEKIKGFLEINGGGNDKMVLGTVHGNIDAVKNSLEDFLNLL
jgi:alanyl-tRNA synthetase